MEKRSNPAASPLAPLPPDDAGRQHALRGQDPWKQAAHVKGKGQGHGGPGPAHGPSTEAPRDRRRSGGLARGGSETPGHCSCTPHPQPSMDLRPSGAQG